MEEVRKILALKSLNVRDKVLLANYLGDFAEAVQKEERERCAGIVKDWADTRESEHKNTPQEIQVVMVLRIVEDLIRKGETQ